MRSKKDHLRTGQIGENIAREYLENKGYKFIEQNYKNKWGEIDLICEKDETIVFIEVKTRTEDRFGSPELAINNKKIQRLIKNSMAYMKFNKIDKSYRIDAISIILEGSGQAQKMNHYENITM